MITAEADVPYKWIRIRAIPGTEHVQLRCARCAETQTVDTISTQTDLGRAANHFVMIHRACRRPTLH